MKQEKDDLNYYKPQLAELEDTELDLEPVFLDQNQNNGITVLFKHDYYSTDSIHGRFLIGKFIKSLIANAARIDKLFFIDTSVRLLDSSNELSSSVKELTDLVKASYVCTESLNSHEVSVLNGLKYNQALASDIAAELFAADKVFIIE